MEFGDPIGHGTSTFKIAYGSSAGALFFVFLFCSIWNGVCSVFFYPSLQKIVAGDAWGFPMACCTCLLPHLPIGVLMPLSLGGPLFCLICIWPYYVTFFKAMTNREPVAIGPPAIRPELGGSHERRLRAVLREVVHSHTSVQPTLQRMTSGGSPRFPERYRAARERLADDHAECAICYEPLCTAPIGCLTDHAGHRGCVHFFHLKCANDLLSNSLRECPVCRRRFSKVIRFPQSGENPELWFRLVNQSGSGSISQLELFTALKAVLPLDRDELDKFATEACSVHGGVTYADTIRPNDGIHATIQKFFHNTSLQQLPCAAPTLLGHESDRSAIFQTWDTEGNRRLDVGEVYRGWVKMFGVQGNTEAEIYNAYLQFDPTFGEGGGITYEVFARRGGLLDTLLGRLQRQLPATPSSGPTEPLLFHSAD